jgi:hypothetical protein
MQRSLIRRSALIGGAVMALGILALGVGVFGLTGINTDSPEQRPVLFTFLIIIPPLVASLSAIFAVSPRIVQINLLVFLGFWAA